MEAVSLEVCSNCGDFVERLQDSTGWCPSCSSPTSRYCSCGTELTNGKSKCGSCRYELFLTTNADALEYYLAKGYTLEAAKQQVFADNRPNCICCGEPIHGGRQGAAFFCSRYKRCKSAKRRYRTLRERYPSTVALQKVQQEILANGTNCN